MLCLLASNNLYIQLQMLDLKKIKLSKYHYEVKQNCSVSRLIFNIYIF